MKNNETKPVDDLSRYLDQDAPQQGYHTTTFPKGTLGEFSKIQEEFLELQDAVGQDQPLLILCELADLCGAMELYLEKHHPSITMDDVLRFAKMTRKAFESGHRS